MAIKNRKQKTHKWKPPTWLKEPLASTALFLHEKVDVYDGFADIKDLKLWRENDRTSLDIEHMLRQAGIKQARGLSDDRIIDHILKEGLHKIPDLADSIERDGVRVPLVVTSDQEVLDGNRRLIACYYLLKRVKEKKAKGIDFTHIPVRCLNPKITDELKLKIISEMNFLKDQKEEWPQQVRAKFVITQYEKFLKAHKNDTEKAYEQIKYYLDENPSDVNRFKAVLLLIEGYIQYVEDKAGKDRIKAESFARDYYHFFEEFYNKALSGRKEIKDPRLKDEATKELYRYINEGRLTSIIKVRDFAKMVRVPEVLSYLKKRESTFDGGLDLYYEVSKPREAYVKITQFCDWLDSISEKEITKLSPAAVKRLLKSVEKLGKVDQLQ